MEPTIPRAYHHHNKAQAITSIKIRLGIPLLRDARSHLKPIDHDSHTKYYTYHERVTALQPRVSSERTFGAGCTEQVSDAPPRLDERQQESVHWFAHPLS